MVGMGWKIIKIWKALPSETKLQPNEWHTDYKSFLEIVVSMDLW
jgi:hypothetical protein